MITLGLNDKIENKEKFVDEVKLCILIFLELKTSCSDRENNCVSSCDVRGNPLAQNIQPRSNLTQIDLSNFKSNLKHWPHFKDMFHSLIRDNAVLPEIVKKCHYLMSSLKSSSHHLGIKKPLACLRKFQPNNKHANNKLSNF